MKWDKTFAHTRRGLNQIRHLPRFKVNCGGTCEEGEDIHVVFSAARILRETLLPVCSILNSSAVHRLRAIHKEDIILVWSDVNLRQASFVSLDKNFGHVVEGGVAQVGVLVNTS